MAYSTSATSNWVVQKFGGTSVGKFPVQIVDEIVKYYSSSKQDGGFDNDVAVVCSARSSYTKQEGTTSRLLKCCDLASQDQEYSDIIETIRQDHVSNTFEADKYLSTRASSLLVSSINLATKGESSRNLSALLT